jgi:hypothetical protein
MTRHDKTRLGHTTQGYTTQDNTQVQPFVSPPCLSHFEQNRHRQRLAPCVATWPSPYGHARACALPSSHHKIHCYNDRLSLSISLILILSRSRSLSRSRRTHSRSRSLSHSLSQDKDKTTIETSQGQKTKDKDRPGLHKTHKTKDTIFSQNKHKKKKPCNSGCDVGHRLDLAIRIHR